LWQWVPVCQEGRLIRQLLRKLMTPLAMRLNSEAEVSVFCVTHVPTASYFCTCQRSGEECCVPRLLWLWQWVPVCQEGRLIRQLLRKLMTPLAMRLNSEAEVGAFCATYVPTAS
jgi:hypothetical protein